MDGELVPMPLAHYYGRLSEEFGGALPTQIIAEQRRLPVGFLEQVLEYRSYARAHELNEVDPKGWDSTPTRRLAKEIEHAIAHEDMTNG